MSDLPEKKFKFFAGDCWKIDEKIRKEILEELDSDFWSTDVIKHDHPDEGWGDHKYLEKIVHAKSHVEEDMVSPLDMGDPKDSAIAQNEWTRSAPLTLRAFVQCIAEKNKGILATMLSPGYFLLMFLSLLFYHYVIILLLFLLLLFVFLLDLAKGAWLQMSVQKHWGPGTTEAQNDKHIHVDYGILLIYVL